MHLFVWFQEAQEEDLIAASHLTMASYGAFRWKTVIVALLAVFLSGANSADIFLEWVVAVDTTINPFTSSQPVSNQVIVILHYIVEQCLCFVCWKCAKPLCAYRLSPSMECFQDPLSMPRLMMLFMWTYSTIWMSHYSLHGILHVCKN